MSRFVAIIPARGGSKEIPNKNLFLLNDQPLLLYCIKSLQASKLEDFFVSTDCESIIEFCVQNKINYIKRPSNLAEDQSPTIDCIKHAISYLGLNEQDFVLTVQATSPLIEVSDVNNVLDKLGRHESVITVSEHKKILWSSKKENLFPLNHDPKNRLRRQDSEKVFSETGSIYGIRVKQVLEDNTLCGVKNVGCVEIPKSRSFELDDYEDAKILESLIKNKKDLKNS